MTKRPWHLALIPTPLTRHSLIASRVDSSNPRTLSHVISFLFVINNHAFSSCSICVSFLLISQPFHCLLFLTRSTHQRLLFSQLQSPLDHPILCICIPHPRSIFETTRYLNIPFPFRPEVVSVLPICRLCHDAVVKGSILLAALVYPLRLGNLEPSQMFDTQCVSSRVLRGTS